MTRQRTKTEVEANDLDMEMHRLAGRLEQFAKDHTVGAERGMVNRVGNELHGSRRIIRRYMHREDVEVTK